MKCGQNMGVDDPKVVLEGQGHRSKGQGHKVKKRHFRSHLIFEVKGHMGQGQKSRWSRSKVDLEGQRSRSLGQKCDFRSHLTVLQVMFKIKGHRSESKVTWVKVKGQVG